MNASLRLYFALTVVGLLFVSAMTFTPTQVEAVTAKPCSDLSKTYTFNAHGYASFSVPKSVPRDQRDALTVQISNNIASGISEAKTECKQSMDQQQAGFFLDCVSYCTQQHVCDATYNSLGDTECEPKGTTDPHLPPYMTITSGATQWNYNFQSTGSGTSSCNCKDRVKTAAECIGPDGGDCTVAMGNNQGGNP